MKTKDIEELAAEMMSNGDAEIAAKGAQLLIGIAVYQELMSIALDLREMNLSGIPVRT